MPLNWTQIGPSLLGASLVECVEALTVVRRIGTARRWRGPLAWVTLLVLTALGPALTRLRSQTRARSKPRSRAHARP